MNYLSRSKNNIINRWRTPITKSERRLSMFSGGFVGFWVGLFFGLSVLIPVSSLLSAVLYIGFWALLGMVLGALLGRRYTKIVLITCYPLTFFGCD